MKEILIVTILLALIIFLRYTKIGCSITSVIVVRFIQLVHLLLCLFVIFGPFIIKDRQILTIYVLIVSFIIFHWIVSSDVCALTLLEQWCTGKKSEHTFIGRIVKPVYNVTNRTIVNITVGLLFIAFIRLARMYHLI